MKHLIDWLALHTFGHIAAFVGREFGPERVDSRVVLAALRMGRRTA